MATVEGLPGNRPTAGWVLDLAVDIGPGNRFARGRRRANPISSLNELYDVIDLNRSLANLANLHTDGLDYHQPSPLRLKQVRRIIDLLRAEGFTEQITIKHVNDFIISTRPHTLGFTASTGLAAPVSKAEQLAFLHRLERAKVAGHPITKDRLLATQPPQTIAAGTELAAASYTAVREWYKAKAVGEDDETIITLSTASTAGSRPAPDPTDWVLNDVEPAYLLWAAVIDELDVQAAHREDFRVLRDDMAAAYEAFAAGYLEDLGLPHANPTTVTLDTAVRLLVAKAERVELRSRFLTLMQTATIEVSRHIQPNLVNERASLEQRYADLGVDDLDDPALRTHLRAARDSYLKPSTPGLGYSLDDVTKGTLNVTVGTGVTAANLTDADVEIIGQLTDLLEKRQTLLHLIRQAEVAPVSPTAATGTGRGTDAPQLPPGPVRPPPARCRPVHRGHLVSQPRHPSYLRHRQHDRCHGLDPYPSSSTHDF